MKSSRLSCALTRPEPPLSIATVLALVSLERRKSRCSREESTSRPSVTARSKKSSQEVLSNRIDRDLFCLGKNKENLSTRLCSSTRKNDHDESSSELNFSPRVAQHYVKNLKRTIERR